MGCGASLCWEAQPPLLAPRRHGHPAAEGPAQRQDRVAGKGKRVLAPQPVGTRELILGNRTSTPPCPAELSPSRVGRPCSPRSPCRGAASPGVARSRLGSVPALGLTPGVFQSFIFSAVCNSGPLARPRSRARQWPRQGGPRPRRAPGLAGQQAVLRGGESPTLLPVPPAAPAPGSRLGRKHPPAQLPQPAQEGLSHAQPGLGGREGRGEQQTVNIVTAEHPRR